jgi:hypothetical protein
MASVNFNNEPKVKRLKTIDEAKRYLEHGDALDNQWQRAIPEDVTKHTKDSDKPKKGGVF